MNITDHLSFVDEEPVVVELFNNFNCEIGSVFLFVQMHQSPLFQTFLQSGCGLCQSVVGTVFGRKKEEAILASILAVQAQIFQICSSYLLVTYILVKNK